MAKQTINIGASPNDGTGTPLRTAFDYTNQNFTELYTATGPSGNNIVVPGSATITGDLTVDTSTLKVDSANNRVGIGTASPGAGYALDVVGAARITAANGLVIDKAGAGFVDFLNSGNAGANVGTSGTGGLVIYTANGIGGAYSVRHTIAGDGVATWSNVGGVAGTAMTLNATGLGVGGSPTSKLSVFAGADGDVGFFRGGSTRQLQIGTSATAGYLNADNGSAGFELRVNGTARAYFDTSGNVGIGVTPSAWTASYNALNIGSGGSIAAYKSANYDQFYVGSNFFENTSGAWRFINNGYATQYWHNSGSHVWRISTTSNAAGANQPLTWTQAMTLDASGNLLVGKTATGFGTVGNEVKANGEVFSTQASTSNVASTYHVYSTGAAAYRFYVGMGGTVFATNTTISAISDARFKENVQDIDVGLSAILALKPRKFDWKAGKGKDIKGDRGFIAQEFETVFPNLIDEWKENAPEGEAPYKSVRQDLIPVLVKAIQELAARVQTLESK